MQSIIWKREGRRRREKVQGAAIWSVACRECAKHAVHFMLPHCLSFCHMPYPLLPKLLICMCFPCASFTPLSSFNPCLSQTSQTNWSSPLNPPLMRDSYFEGNLLAGPYHLHMHPLGKPLSATLPPQYNPLSIYLTFQPLFTSPNVFIAPCVTQTPKQQFKSVL